MLIAVLLVVGAALCLISGVLHARANPGVPVRSRRAPGRARWPASSRLTHVAGVVVVCFAGAHWSRADPWSSMLSKEALCLLVIIGPQHLLLALHNHHVRSAAELHLP